MFYKYNILTAGMHCQPECFALSCGMSVHSHIRGIGRAVPIPTMLLQVQMLTAGKVSMNALHRLACLAVSQCRCWE